MRQNERVQHQKKKKKTTTTKITLFIGVSVKTTGRGQP